MIYKPDRRKVASEKILFYFILTKLPFTPEAAVMIANNINSVSDWPATLKKKKLGTEILKLFCCSRCIYVIRIRRWGI